MARPSREPADLQSGTALLLATVMAHHDEDDERVPCTVLTGFLGSGKTTLLNHILTAQHGKRIAVIENELGAIGIDDALLSRGDKATTEEDIVETLNGCICCTVRKDLVDVFHRLAERVALNGLELDAVVIETTGMANPGPVAQTFYADELVGDYFRLDGIVTLVDAKHVEQHLDEVKEDGVVNESERQVAFGDRILLNKTDLVPDEAALERIEARLRSINSLAPIMRCCQSQVDVASVMNIGAFGLDRALEIEPDFMNEKIVTKHDGSVSSVAITAPGNVSFTTFNNWVSDLLHHKSADIYRMKGVLCLDGAPERPFVFHAVHMVFEKDFGEAWKPGEEGQNKLVIIGRNLDEAAYREKFEYCMSTPENRERWINNLRFREGDVVECATPPVDPDSDEPLWLRGTIVKLLYNDTRFPRWLPYQVRLEIDDRLIFAPVDSDDVVRAPLE